MGIADILRKNDAKRAANGGVAKHSLEREAQARLAFSETVAARILAALKELRDPALGEISRLPIAAKPSQIGIFFECLGLVRLTLHCIVVADGAGVAYCSSIDLAMSRGGKIVRGSIEPLKANAGIRVGKNGVPEHVFALDAAKLKKAVEALANQL
jgi:hypothetical protein